jgi:sulfate adenylyltransferase
MQVNEKAPIDKAHECRQVFKTTDPHHPGVEKVLAQGPVNLAGPVKVLSEMYFPQMFAEIYQRPAEARQMFEARGWTTVAAMQTRSLALTDGGATRASVGVGLPALYQPWPDLQAVGPCPCH